MKIGFAARVRKFAAAVERIDTTKLFLQAAADTSELALNLNRIQLLTQGIDSEGKSLGKYTEATKKKKRAKGQETEFKTMYDTGEFQDAMYLETKKLPIFIGSKDEKAPILKKVYGPILGLTKENQADYTKEVLEAYRNKVHHQIENLKDKILL